MTGTNHGMTGAVIALLVKEPMLAIPLSFASHFVCDAIPHFGIKDGKLFGKAFNVTLVVDFLVAISLMAILGIVFPAQKWVIWASMIAAASPDLAWAYYHLYLEKIKHRKAHLDALAKFHSVIQWSETLPGASVEFFWFLLMGLTILSRR